MNLLLSTITLMATLTIGGLNNGATTEPIEDGPYYNLRYCEILLANLEGLGTVKATVFNTQPCNLCPEEEWDALNFRAIAKDYDALLAIPNGPRYFVMDDIESTADLEPCTDNIGGIDMTYVATVNISTRNALSRKPYVAAEVERGTVYEYRTGREVYTLSAPDGQCYIMQTYSQQVYDTQSLEDLKNLGNILDLPRGWSFNVIQLEANFYLEAPNDNAMVIQDEFQNSYQLLHEGCLE